MKKNAIKTFDSDAWLENKTSLLILCFLCAKFQVSEYVSGLSFKLYPTTRDNQDYGSFI